MPARSRMAWPGPFANNDADGRRGAGTYACRDGTPAIAPGVVRLRAAVFFAGGALAWPQSAQLKTAAAVLNGISKPSAEWTP